MMARPKDREFGTLGKITSTKDREGCVGVALLSIPLFKFWKSGHYQGSYGLFATGPKGPKNEIQKIANARGVAKLAIFNT